MSTLMRSFVQAIFVLSVFITTSAPAVAASSKGGGWRSRPIIILCEGNPVACPCPTC